MKKILITVLIFMLVFSFIGCNQENNNNSAADIINLPTSDAIEASEEVRFWAQDGINMLIRMLTIDGFMKDNDDSSELITIEIKESKITNLQLVKQLKFNDKETIDLYILDFKLLPGNLADDSLFVLDHEGWIPSDDNFIFADANGYEVDKGQLYLLIHNNNGEITSMGIRRAEPLTETWCNDLIGYYNVPKAGAGDAVTITADPNSYTPLMSSVQGITLTPELASKTNYKNLVYHWKTTAGEFIGFGQEANNQGEAVIWSAVEKDKVAEIMNDFDITLEVTESESGKVLASAKITITADGKGFYRIKE